MFNASFEAIDPTKGNKRVGVFVCSVVKNGIPSALDLELEKMECDEKMGKIADILDYAKSRAAHLIKEGEEHLDMGILSVASDYGGKGIGDRLFKVALSFAKDRNLRVSYVGCTSEISARLAIKNGFQVVDNIRYDKYLKNGVQVFHPIAPHDTLRPCIKFLH